MSAVVEYHGGEISTAGQVVAQTLRVQEILKAVMKKDVHYGVIPGTKKNTLYKPGAEILCAAFHIAPTYEVVEDRFDDGVRYRVKCIGVHQGSGTVIAEGLGSCSSMEEKYKWRKAYKTDFDHTDATRRRMDYGWDNTKRVEYEIMQVRVETADIENTLLKMASKRAMIAMVLNAVAASDVFAQDLEDLSKKVLDTMVDDADRTEDDKRKPLKTAQSKSGSGEVDKTTGEVTSTTVASEGMLAWMNKKLEPTGKTLDDAKKHFGINGAPLTEAKCKEIVAWAQTPEGSPTETAAV